MTPLNNALQSPPTDKNWCYRICWPLLRHSSSLSAFQCYSTRVEVYHVHDTAVWNARMAMRCNRQSLWIPAEFPVIITQYLHKVLMTRSRAGLGRYQFPCRMSDLCLGPCTQGGQEETRSVSVPLLSSFHPEFVGPVLCLETAWLRSHCTHCTPDDLGCLGTASLHELCLWKAKLSFYYLKGTAQVSSLPSEGVTHKCGCPCKL